ncbi:hypothetical protein [Streptomyces sp. NPDC049887]|uniref:hypothetical protein n=2 Tax=Streptomyces TaxID=1883 RepID=UPI00342546AA
MPRHGRIGTAEGGRRPGREGEAMPGGGNEENDDQLLAADARAGLSCPSCGSSHVAQVLGDNGGISYVCTACGHSWS